MKWLKKPLPAALLLVILWTGFRLAYMRHSGLPQPLKHDEFSYLLGADTFAHGRLANPPHPLAKFFESPHVLVRPVYASKYPPGQALVLALGQKLFGSPFYGVLIGNALMLFAFCLMLCAWVPFPWAITVSGLIALYLRPRAYWTGTYWGGSLAATGAAFVLLGIGICRVRKSAWGGIAFAFGGLLLFWTRPFEGFIFTLLMLIVFAADLWRNRNLRMVIGALAVFAIGGIWNGYYDWSVTGKPLTLPYLLHDRQYNVTPPLAILPLRPEPVYSTPRLAAQHGLHGEEAIMYQAGKPRLPVLASGFLASLHELIEPLGLAALLTLLFPAAWRNPVYRRVAIVSLVFLLALSIETFHFAHYAAPIWAALALMIAIWAQSVWDLRLGKLPFGIAVVVLVLLSLPAHDILSHFRKPAEPSNVASTEVTNREVIAGDSATEDWSPQRAGLIQGLSALDRPQLVIVRYPAPNWRVSEEWVYNGADIDSQRVIFAHDFGPDQDRALLSYYPNRTVSLLTFDSASGQEHLQPYPGSPTQ
jgi:hypothetical protein